MTLAFALGLPGARSLPAPGGDEFIDTVDAEVGGRGTVLGTLRPAEERESFLIALPRGAKLKATAKGTGPDAPGVAVEVLDPHDAPLATSGPAKSAKTPQIVIAESGVHHVRVFGDGVLDGDYKLKVKAKMPRSASAASTVDLAPGAEATFTFGAGDDATATVKLAASKHSPFLATIVEITGPDGFVSPVAAPDTPGSRHVVRGISLGGTGDYSVRFRNDGAAAGGWTAKVQLKTPKVARSTLTITDGALAGEFAGEQAVFARSIDAPGGVVTPTGDAGDLLGVSVEVPAGAVSEPTLFTVSAADPFFVDDDLHEGGATFELGPAGIAFTEDVTVTVPFDAQAFDDPSSEVQIAIRDGDSGEVAVVTGSVDVVAGTVTFQTPHFSGFQAVSPQPRPLRGGFVELQLSGGIDPSTGGKLTLGVNSLVGQKGPRTGNVVARSLDRYTVRFGGDGQGGAVLSGAHQQTSDVGRATADQTLTLAFGNDVASYLRARNSDVLVRSDVQGDGAGVAVLLRRVLGRPTQGALRGDWHGVVVELAAARGAGGALGMSTTGQRFELSVGPLGRAAVTSSDMYVTRFAYPSGTPATDRIRKTPKRGTLRPSGTFARLTLDVGTADGAPFIDLHPVVRGDMLVGVTGGTVGDAQNPSGALTRMVILVRAGAKGGDDDLMGRSQLVAVDAGFEVQGGVGTVVPTLGVLGLDVIHDGLGGLRARGNSVVVRRGVTGAIVIDAEEIDDTGKYRIDKDLSYSETFPLGRGALLRRRGLYVATDFTAGRLAVGFGIPSRPAPE